MVVSGPVDLIRALAQALPTDVLGTPESGWVDFKRDPHDVRAASGKWELAKDVAALANGAGGLLVCGVLATRAAHEPAETAQELWPFDQSDVNLDAYKQVLLSGVQPPPQVHFHWFEHPADQAHSRPETGSPLHYLVMEVIAYPDGDKYGLVRRWRTEDDRVVDGIAIPIRHGDGTRWLSAAEIYRLVNDGHGSRMGGGVRETLPREASADPRDIVDRIERSQEWEDQPVVYWQTTPIRPPDLLAGWLDAVREGLAHPNVLRAMGFNFANPYEQVRQEGDLLILADRRMAMSVSMQGTVTAGTLATGEFLGWSMQQRGYAGRLNVIALTESCLEYFRFTDDVVVPRVPDSSWVHRLVGRRLQSADPVVMLGEGANPDFPFHGRVSTASADDWNQSWPAVGDVGVDAFAGLQRLYALFGLPVTTNPYVEGERLSPERFLELLPPG